MAIISDPVFYIKWTAIWIAILTVLVLTISKEKYEHKSKLVFLLFVIPVMLSTFYLAGHTVYKNVHSITGGPVHWHADYQVWVCGERLDLINPTGMKNKIGTPLFHEHNDDRIHVEGTVNSINDINLGAYFEVIGGKLTSDELVYVTEDMGTVEVKTGDLCGDEPSQLNVYVNGKKINNANSYMYYPHPQVPPGDCIIVEFGPNLPDATQKICDFWEVNGWTYENYKQLREENPNYSPVWKNENWQYIDGIGMVEVKR